VTLARATAVADFYGPDHYGSIGGVVGMFVTAARTLAPVGAAVLRVGITVEYLISGFPRYGDS
jgi:hypothetical protein